MATTSTKNAAPRHPRRRNAPRTSPQARFRVEHDRLVLGDLIVTFQRTLRVADDGLNALPPGFGCFPLRVVDPLRGRIPDPMLQQGGVIMPMYQSEAMWISLQSDEPVAIQIGTGGRCVVSGEQLANRLVRRPQNYVVVPEQPWIDGYKTADGEVRQFVAVNAGSGLSVEHQLTGGDRVGGIQIQVFHLQPEALQRWRDENSSHRFGPADFVYACASSVDTLQSMAIGMGGRIQQEIYPDTFRATDWRKEPTARVWVHLVSAPQWPSLTGEPMPHTPVSTDAYIAAGLPWFDYYDEAAGDLPPTSTLGSLKSVSQLSGAHDAGTAWVHPHAEHVIRLRGRRKAIVDPGTWDWC